MKLFKAQEDHDLTRLQDIITEGIQSGINYVEALPSTSVDEK